MISFACKEIHTATEGFACIFRSHSLRRLSLDCFFEKKQQQQQQQQQKEKKNELTASRTFGKTGLRQM